MRYTLRGASVAAIGGALLLFGGTILHPSGADPNDAVAAFSEYADDQWWIASHLTQLLGVALIVCALIQLSRLLASGSARGLAWIGAAAAYGVRQIEVGLASIMSLLFGLTVCVYGVAVISDRSFVTWLGWLAIIGGISTAIAGVVIAYTGFSGLAMSINMPSSLLLLIWMIALGILFWRRDTEESATGSSE
jgi:hypothetical protein